MGLDAILKRYFPAVVCLLIALAAYFQASGMGELVASSALLDPSSMPPPPPAPKGGLGHTPQGAERTVNAGPILSRNPFDSVTGPLDGKQIDLPQQPETPAPDGSDPYADPICDVGKCLLITQSDDPDWSFAALAGADGKSQMRRRGDDFGGHTIFWIGWDRVWLTHSGSRCQMQVHGAAPQKLASSAPAAPTATPDAGKTSKGSSRKVPAEIASKIHKVSETQFDVERSVVDQILENQSELMRSARIVPEKEGDKVVGIRLFGVRPESLLGTLGLENGDRLQSINGFEMSDPQKALEAYARLRSAEKLTVSVNRRGKPMTIDFNIK